MNARMIVLACLLATVGVPARSAAVVLAPTTVDVHTLEFEPTQNARPGSSGVMTIRSEERRVGKEGGAEWAPFDGEKTTVYCDVADMGQTGSGDRRDGTALAGAG